MKVLGRAGNLPKGPEKAFALLQMVLKDRYLPCHKPKRKDPVQSADLFKGPGKGRESSGRS